MLNGLRRRLAAGMLSPLCKDVVRQRLTYLRPERLSRLERAMRTVRSRRVPGAVCEFGVALGGSGILLADFARRDRREFHGFDVFATIPPPTSEKDDARSKERYKVIASGASEGIGGDEYYGYTPDLFERVKASFGRNGVPVDGRAVMLHRGLFEETWPEAGVGQVALAHIDCDWYDPVIYCLDAVADRVAPGGILIIDDYHDYGGARTAVDEFVARRVDFELKEGANPFLVKRSPS
jgi:asparagine synthase (glutamine-hydrolysing)